MSDIRTAGQLAFEAYNVSKGGFTYDGKPIPPWSDVGDAVRTAWEAAAAAVLAWQASAMAELVAKLPAPKPITITIPLDPPTGQKDGA